MEETVAILRGRLRRWQSYMETLGKAAEYLAEQHELKPHPIDSANRWVYEAELYREILPDFGKYTGISLLESTISFSDETVLTVKKGALARWIRHLTRRLCGALGEELEPSGRLNTPELWSKNSATASCYGVARKYFFEMTGVREALLNPLWPDVGVVGYDEFIDHKFKGVHDSVKEFCIRFNRSIEQVRETYEATSKKAALSPEQWLIVNEYMRFLAMTDIEVAENSLVGIEQDPELSVEAEALRAAMDEQLPDMDVDLGDLRARALDLAEKWKARKQ
jgi:hypothetical protein